MHFHASKRLGVLFAAALALAGCGGDPEATTPTPTPSSATITGQAFKGPLSGATVCVYAINDAAADKKGALVPAQAGSTPTVSNDCVVTASNGSYSYVLPPNTTSGLLVEATGGTWCSDESTPSGSSCTSGTAQSLGSTALRTVVNPPASGTVDAPLTLLTTAATQAPSSLSPSTFQTAYNTVATRFGVPTDASTAPTDTALNDTLQSLAHYVGTTTADLGDIVAGLAAGTLTPTNTTFPTGIELAVGADQKTMRVFKADATGATLVSTATLPGIPGGWSRAGTTVTVSQPDHGIRDGLWIPLAFKDSSGHAVTSGIYKVTVVDDSTYTATVDAAAFGTTTSGSLYRDPVSTLTATYTQAAGDSFITLTLPDHGLQSGDGLDLHFTSGGATDLISSVSNVIDANTVQVRLPAAANDTTSGNVELRVGGNYTSFDVVMHPSGKWLYVTSGYDCSNGSPFCWGGDVITTFQVEWNRGQITPVATYRTGPGDSYAIPVNMAVNAAGTLLVNQDDSLDGLRLWTIDPATGVLNQVAQSAANSTNQHGVTFSADGQYVYHGSRVFTVGTAPYSIALTQSNTTGNSGAVVGNTLFSINANGSSLYAFSLTDPANPVQITMLGSVPTNRSLSTRDGKLLVTSGPGGVKTYTFDGMAFAPAAPASGSAALQRDGSTTLGDGTTMYRSVDLNAAGTIALSTYFTPTSGTKSRGGPPTGYVFAKVGSDGQLERIADLSLGNYVRTAKFFKQPQ